VLEIGAGLGALTDRLLARGCSVVAIERDRDLLPILEQVFAADRERGRLELVEADAKAANWDQLLGQHPRRVLAGNLPYQITGPLLRKTIRLAAGIARAVYLVQKEVADRLAAAPGSGDYGALSIFVQAAFGVERALVIRPGSFYPTPRVDSAVVVLTPLAEPWTRETPAFRALVKLAFSARRKTLRNAWRSLGAGDELERAAREAGVRLEARGETLAVADYARMARLIADAPGIVLPTFGGEEEA